MTPRALNRATLARQMLLAREKTTVLRTLERLVAMQAQLPRPPFVGLWSRMVGFRREDLAKMLAGRKAVRATSLRGTLHLMTATDFLSFRGAIQPALTKGTESLLRGRLKSDEVEALVRLGRGFFAESPRTFEEFRELLEKRHPKGDVRAMAYAVRTHLPLVQVPGDQTWGFPTSPAFAEAESWLGATPNDGTNLEPLVLRYLAAFGPATPADVQTWSGLSIPSVREAFDALRPKLVELENERGRELFDLPKSPRPAEDTEAPPRFLPEFDNLVLSHTDRKRFVADAHRRAVFLPGLRVAPTFLVDGFVAGTWKIERAKQAATMMVQPFAALPKAAKTGLEQEGEELARFVEADAGKVGVKFERA